MGLEFWLLGLGLFLVIEGMLPFLTPRGWREAVQRLSSMDDTRIRLFGLACLIAGLLLVLAVTS
ncbi:MAG: DUF2065 domain-containing protein [Comamonas sp.]